MSYSDHELLDVAVEAAEIGAREVVPIFESGVEARAKEGAASYDLVTDADVACERAIGRFLAERCPGHAFLGEEGQTDGEGRRSVTDDLSRDEFLWIVDPIDGTTNFASGIPHFAISIACYRFGQPACGVVLNPARGDRYEAVRGRGAKHNGEPIRVSTATSLGDSLIGCGFYYDRGAMMKATLGAIEEIFSHHIRGIRRMGTASLDLCQVAAGMYGGFFEYQLSPWDFAAGRLVLTEAGGQITTCRGDALPLTTTSVLASNSTLHSELEAITTRHAANLPEDRDE